MAFSFTFKHARSEIAAARRSLQSGYGMNWIGGHLLSVTSCSIDAWLTLKGYEPGASHSDRYLLFYEKASESLWSELNTLSSGWMTLEYRLLGDPDDVVEIMPIEEWKILAATYISDAEKYLSLIEADAGSKIPHVL